MVRLKQDSLPICKMHNPPFAGFGVGVENMRDRHKSSVIKKYPA
jgi:hypothetical protein